MKNILILSLLFPLFWMLTGCNKKDEMPDSFPKQIKAGNDTIVYDVNQVQLNASSVDSIKLEGTWRIIEGETAYSGFSDIHNPKTVFHGIYREKYVLEWSVSNELKTLSDSITVRFIASIPPYLTAGFLYLVYEKNYVVLNGTALKAGLLGQWSIRTNDSSNITISNKNIANPVFTGRHLNSYFVRWSVSNGLEGKYADAKIVIGDMFTDLRDARRYKKVQIGGQNWMAEDLKTDRYANGEILTRLPYTTSLYDNNVKDKVYFKRSDYYDWYGVRYPIDDEGYFYTWAAVMNNSLSTDESPSNVQGICPYGWHVPSSKECIELTTFITADYKSDSIGIALRTNYGWNNHSVTGTNYYGFSALPKGYQYSGYYGDPGMEATFWVTLENNYSGNGASYYARFFCIAGLGAVVTSSAKTEGRCVRCLENK